MNANATSSLDAALLGCALLLAVLAVSSYWAFKSWSSSPQQWQERLRHLRPESWEKWPIYSWIWRHADRHPNWELWQARILSAVVIVGCVLALLVFGSEAVSGLKGQ